MPKIAKKSRNKTCKSIGDHETYISRITKTLYYGKLPKTDRLSLPVTELAAELFSESQHGKSLNRLHLDDAAAISRNACVSPCSLVLAILYLERLKTNNTEFLERTSPSDLFLVSLMVSSKFLYDDGESDEVYMDEWAQSAGKTVKQLIQLEKDFLNAISWEIFVNELMFWQKLTEVETKLAEREGCTRGHFTYTELHHLLETIDVHNVIQCFVTVSVVLAASYIAGLMTMLGSVALVSHIPGSYLQQLNQKLDDDNLQQLASNHHHTINNTNSRVLPIMIPDDDDEIQNLIPTDDNNNNIVEWQMLVDSRIENETDELIKMKTDVIFEEESKTKTGLNLLKTGLFLASIEGFMKPFCGNNKNNDTSSSLTNDNNVQNVSWDWWTIPTMIWLSDSSADLIENYCFKLPRFDLRYFGFFLDAFVSNTKHMELEDQIHKATKTRIQDQIEGSWHKEWTDTIHLYFVYSQNILKS